MAVMPGSHRMGALTKGDPHEEVDGQAVLTPKKGTLVLLHRGTACRHRVASIDQPARRAEGFADQRHGRGRVPQHALPFLNG